MRSNNKAVSDDVSIAKDAWAVVKTAPEEAFAKASGIRTRLNDSSAHEALAWAALICGRVEACRENISAAEMHLAEAIGRFVIIGNDYGRLVAEAHLSITFATQSEHRRALLYALRPWNSNVQFSDSDADLLHTITAYAYWANDDYQAALLHHLKALEIADRLGSSERRAAVSSNIGLILLESAEVELALMAFKESWRLVKSSADPLAPISLNAFVNLIGCYLLANEVDEAIRCASLLKSWLKNRQAQTNWPAYRALCLTALSASEFTEAERWLSLTRAEVEARPTDHNNAFLLLTEANYLEARGEFASAISSAQKVLDSPIELISKYPHRLACECMARCYSALSKSSQSRIWKNAASKLMPPRFLSEIFSRQIRRDLSGATNVRLTDTERECLALSARGQTSADIAQKLGIKPRTVNFHFSKVLRKLNALNRQEAIAKAYSANLLT